MQLVRDVATGTEEAATKVCPQCGQELFADMGKCFGCLYDFSRKDAPPRGGVILSAEPQADEDLGQTSASALAVVPPQRGGGAAWSMTGTAGGALGVFVQTGDVDVTIPLAHRGITVGRAPTSDVVLHSRAVSRTHVKLSPRGDGALVEDCGATNPALMRGREVAEPCVMHVGDTLDVCGALLTLVRQEDGGGDAA